MYEECVSGKTIYVRTDQPNDDKSVRRGGGSASYFFDVAVQSDVRATAFAVGPPRIVYNLFVMLKAI